MKGDSYTVRRAESSDASQLKKFSCGNRREPWTYDTQKLIQSEVRQLVKSNSSRATVVLALEDNSGRVIGVICYGVADAEAMTVFALAVVPDRRLEGIATRLKQGAMADCAADGVVNVLSTVHAKNQAMQEVNRKMGVKYTPDPDDPEEYRLYMAVTELTEP